MKFKFVFVCCLLVQIQRLRVLLEAAEKRYDSAKSIFHIPYLSTDVRLIQGFSMILV